MRIRPHVRTKREYSVVRLFVFGAFQYFRTHGNIESHCHYLIKYYIFTISIPFDGNERSILSLGRSARGSTIVERVDFREAEKYCVVIDRRQIISAILYELFALMIMMMRIRYSIIINLSIKHTKILLILGSVGASNIMPNEFL